LLHALMASTTIGGAFAMQVPTHASVRGTGHALTHRTTDEQAPSPAHAWSWVQQF
jgi:hypothetical protein